MPPRPNSRMTLKCETVEPIKRMLAGETSYGRENGRSNQAKVESSHLNHRVASDVRLLFLFVKLSKSACLLMIDAQAALIFRHVPESELQVLLRRRKFADFHRGSRNILRRIIGRALVDVLIHPTRPILFLRQE